MSYNPLEFELAEAQTALAQLRDRHRELDQELRWHAQFEVEKNNADLRALTERHAALLPQVEESRLRLHEAQTLLKERREDASLGWNPTRWFSERSAAKRRQAEQQAIVDDLLAQHRGMEEQFAELEGRKAGLERDLHRYASIDAADGRNRLVQLDGEIALQELKVADLARRKERADARLAPLLNQLHEREREATQLAHTLEIAESFQHRLDYAANGYERKQIHDRCERQLGRSSPGAIIREVQQQRRALDRDLEKLHRRIADEARRSARDIRAVVIDGNNLCYEGTQFIGLAALIPVVDVLSRGYDVTLVFDRSIQTKWRFSEGELASSFPTVKVHVVRSRRAADELILDVARDPYVVVLSNDRYGEFRDKDAVRDGRTVGHDILNGRVSVPDLDIEAPLAVMP